MSKAEPTKIDKSKSTKPRKERTGVPQTDMLKAVEYIKKGYDEVGNTTKSFGGMAEAMGITPAFASRAFGELRDYGLLEQSEDGWVITELGKRVANGDIDATIESFCKNSVMRDLYNNFNTKDVGEDVIEEYIRKRGQNLNAKIVARRFLAALQHFSRFGPVGITLSSSKDVQSSSPIVKVYLQVTKLKYALNPPKTVKKLATAVASSLGESDDVALKTLASSIKAHIEDVKVLPVLVENVIQIMSEKYKNVVPSVEEDDEPPQKKEEKTERNAPQK